MMKKGKKTMKQMAIMISGLNQMKMLRQKHCLLMKKAMQVHRLSAARYRERVAQGNLLLMQANIKMEPAKKVAEVSSSP